LRPGPPGELTALPRSSSWILEREMEKENGKGWDGKGTEGEGTNIIE